MRLSPQNCGRLSAKVHIITLIHRQLDVSFSPCLPIFCEWISFLIIIHTHQQKNPSIRGHSLKNVDTFWRQNLNVEHSDSSFSMRSLLLLFFTHQFHNTKMKKQLPFPPYYYCCQVQKNCDTLWYETTYHILHTTTQPPHKHTLNCHWLKKVNKQLTSAAAASFAKERQK